MLLNQYPYCKSEFAKGLCILMLFLNLLLFTGYTSRPLFPQKTTAQTEFVFVTHAKTQQAFSYTAIRKPASLKFWFYLDNYQIAQVLFHYVHRVKTALRQLKIHSNFFPRTYQFLPVKIFPENPDQYFFLSSRG